MTHAFDKAYWEAHWKRPEAGDPASVQLEVNPHVRLQTPGLPQGTALDAGCGEGTEALWLANQGWDVTGADISRAALDVAAHRSAHLEATVRPAWIEADLVTWEPDTTFDLVVTNYAHPTIPQLDFYRRLATWVAPGGTFLIVAHLHEAAPGAGHAHPAEASVTGADIIATFEATEWRIDTATEGSREVTTEHGTRTLRDAVVRATRLR